MKKFEFEVFFNKNVLLVISVQKEFLERWRHSISQWTVWLYVFLFQFSSFLLFERLLMKGDVQNQAICRPDFNKYFEADTSFL